MKGYASVKSVLDFIGALLLLLLLGWVIVLCMIAIKLDDPKESVLYIGTRVGRHKRPFKMYKLRTMSACFSGMDAVLDETLTRPGKIIRKLSLDELPQLINILAGEMSFIGPRPLLLRYLQFYSESENRRHEVMPGITGLAQINGRMNLNWDKRFALDLEYVDNMSLYLDLKILFLTIKKVFVRENSMLSLDSQVTESFDDYRIKQMNNGWQREFDAGRD